MHARFSDVVSKMILQSPSQLTRAKILYHGLTPALVLSQALAKSRSNPSSLPDGLRRPSIIRHLSSFVSQLESISGPGEANYDLSSTAAKMITATLDEVLESAETGLSPTASNTMSTPVDFDMTSFTPEIPDIWAGFDINDWQKNFDWNLGYDCF